MAVEEIQDICLDWRLVSFILVPTSRLPHGNKKLAHNLSLMFIIDHMNVRGVCPYLTHIGQSLRAHSGLSLSQSGR